MAKSVFQIRKPGKRGARTGVAMLSVISLALGSAAHLPGPARAAEAAAAEGSGSSAKYTGGVFGADGKGVMQGSDLIASDLSAGSCTVTSGKQSFEQAGFKAEIFEPGPGKNSDKRAFGASVEFTGDKQRTFNDWLILGSNNNAPVTRHTVKAAAPSDPFPIDAFAPTRDADEVMTINKVGRDPLTATIAADLDGKKIAEYAKATAENPVRYAWSDRYTEDNDKPARQIFSDPYIEATVNPWPNENDDCSPITVDWKPIKQMVIEPDEPVEVGKINAQPKTLKRIVVEAHDQQGNLLGSTDGDEPKLVVEDDGTVKYTSPKYVGNKAISGDQNVTFTVVANPRTVEELDAAAADGAAAQNKENWAKVSEESNSLPRYSTPNMVSTSTITLDDTKFHDPEYDAADKAIISGTESENGPVTNEPQQVTFEQTGARISELIKKKADGGNNATVELNTRYVYEGWKATLDPETNNVTVTAPANPKPGTFAQPRVVVTYSNGSRDMIPLLVLVDPNNTQVTELAPDPETVSGVQGAELKSKVGYQPTMSGYDAVKPTKFEIDPASVPEGWDVKVDEDGTVTATSPSDAPNNSHANVKVLATYPDGTTDETNVDFKVAASVKVPDYQAVTGKAQDKVSLTPTIPNIGIGGEEDDEAPSSYSFPDGGTTLQQGEWFLTINPETGEVTSEIPADALPGASLTFPVQAHYASGATPQVTTGTINVVGDKQGADVASYPPRQTKPGVAVTSDISTQLKDPKSATYKLPDPKYRPKGWTFAIDDNGTVTATPDASLPDGATADLPVTVTYPDGSSATVPAEFSVVSTASGANNPNYKTVHGQPGDEVKSPVDTTYVNPAYEPKYEFITDPNDPSYIPLPRNLSWDDLTINPDTGEITMKISSNAKPGTSAQVPVRVNYNDGSSDVTSGTFIVDAEARQIYNPDYLQAWTSPGGTQTSKPTAASDVPWRDLADNVDDRYSVPAEIDGWTFTVDYDGTVHATAPKGARAGDHVDVPVTVTYYDGSKDVVYAPFVVRDKQAELYEPGYPAESTTPGKEVTRSITPKNLPEGSTFSFGMDGDTPITQTEENGWKYSIDPKTGDITVTPPADAKPGDKQTKNATVTYPDGSTDEAPVTTIVSLTQNFEVEPTYPAESVYPGTKTSLPLTLDNPNGVEVAAQDPYKIRPAKNYTDTGDVNEFGNPVYKVKTANGDWLVSLDKDGTVLAESPATAKPGDAINVPVSVKYADGSVDRVSAPVTVVDQPTREVPFKVEYKYDNTLPAGQYKVEKEGTAGAEKQNEDGTWTRTQEPTNEVVLVGTQQAKATDEVTWTVPLPFPTTMRPNPDLQPGETKVVQEGANGEETYTATFDAEGDQASHVESTKRTDPVERIVEYGPQLGETELVTKTTKQLPFDTEVKADPNLDAGKTEVEKAGVLGEETETSTQKLVDGKPSGDPVVSTERTKEPETQIIRVGTKQSEQPTPSVPSASVSVPFTTIVEFDDTLPAGEQREKQVGKDGKGVVENGELKITEEPTPRIIVVGTKQATDPATDPGTDPETQAPKDYSWTESTAFDVEIRENPDLPKGEKRVVRDGERGEETHTVHFELKDGVYAPQETTEVTKEPVNKIVEIGTKGDTPTEPTQPGEPQETEQSVVTIERLPFDTEVIEDPALEAGEVVVEKPGAPGKQQTVTTQKYKDGKPTGEPTITSTVLVEPENRVMRVGTKQPEQPTPSVPSASVSLPFTTIVEFDDTLPAGEQREKQPGKDGKGVVENGELKITEPATPRVIVVGTKQATDPATDPGTDPETQAPKDYSWTESTAFDVEIRENPDLPKGEKRVVRDGERGEETHTVHFELKDGVYTPQETTEVTKEPVNKIVEIGTKGDTPTEPTQPGEPQETEQSVVTIERLPFDTEVIEDPTLEAGEVVVEKPGAPGKQQTVTTQKYKDGKPVGEPTSASTVLEEPENRVMRVGTKPAEAPEVKPVTTDLPFGTKVIFDPTLEAGEKATVTEGVPGRVTVTGTDVERVEPKDEVVRIGTKPVAGTTEAPEEVSWEEPLPFKVIVKQNPDKPRGSVEEITQGKNGTQKRGVRYEIVDGKLVPKEFTEVITPATDHVIEVGTGGEASEITEVNESALPFETEVIEDPTLPAGVVFTEQHGQQGSQRTSRTWKLVDGNVTGDPTVSTETITEPTNRILRVGTGTPHTGEQAKPEERPYFPPVVLGKGATKRVELEHGHVDGDSYEIGDVPEGWDVTIDEATGEVSVTTPDDVEPGTIATIPVKVTRADGSVLETFVKVGVSGKQAEPAEPTTKPSEPTTEPTSEPTSEPTKPTEPTSEPTKPTEPTSEPTTEPSEPTTKPTPVPGTTGSSEDFQRCVANAFAANSPLLWLVPIGLLAAVGGPLSQQFGPQINQAFGEINGQINQKIRENTPDLPDVGMGGNNKPEWYRELEAQANAVNQQFAGLQQQYAGVGEQLRPLGIGLAVIGAAAVGIALINQACKPEGFDGWTSSSKGDSRMTTVRPEGADEASSFGGSSSKDGKTEK
ncbi:G5 domain-containing protein [Corynebacterium sp. NML 120412]|uniref:G5 domain-containing protein n=1 Tax=Corynebacterium sp. NML 120412 TaxID=2029401 RepID=UPI00130402DC|nr:G5 domain-containing protein [Corynebacterium sp. NML 120412]